MYTVSNHVLGLSKQDSVKKNIVIHFPNGEHADIGNDSIYSESMKLQQSLCSQEHLQFGLCEAAQFSIKLIEIEEALKGCEIEVSMYLDGDAENMVQLGIFKIDSDIPTDNKRFREIKAYDALYGLNELDISVWYNSLSFPMALKEFRDSLFDYLGIEQEDVSLVNDDMVVERTISPTEMSTTDVLKAICEINGVFGQIGRDGRFKYVVLEKPAQTSYPSNDLYPSDTLFPNDGATESFHKSLYISCEYEDYEVQGITGIQIRQEENDIGVIVGENANAYVVEDNFLVYGKGTTELQGIANKLLDRISGLVFRPCELDAKALLYLESGDYVKIYTDKIIFCTYILNRTISGIQSLKDSISSNCEQKQSKKVGGVHQSIIQLKKKTNTLDRTLEETRSTLTSLETTIAEDYSTTEEMESFVSQTAESITTSVSKQITETKTHADNAAKTAQDNANSTTDDKLKNYSTTVEMNSAITQTAEAINLEVSKKVGNDEVISKINQTAEKITIKAEKIDLDGLVSATEFTSKFATIDALNVQKARIDTIAANYISASSVAADYATISSLDSVSARVGNIEANFMAADTIHANYMSVSTWTSSGYIKAGKISASNITAGTLSVERLDIDEIMSSMASRTVYCNAASISSSFSFKGKLWAPKTINGVTYLVATS